MRAFALLFAVTFGCGSELEPGPANPANGAAPGLATGGVSAAQGGSSSGGAGGSGTSSASGGVLSAGGNGGMMSAGAAGAPEVSMVGAPYAFPQNKRSAFCVYPAAAKAQLAKSAYERWKVELVTRDGAGGFQRVRRPGNEMDTTVSEGVGYGMILAVTFGEQALFDDLWKYSQKYLNEHGLMHWMVSAAGEVTGEGAATDADEDIAWALVQADKKWGGRGSLDRDYIELAKTQIDRIWQHEIDHSRNELVLAGDSWGATVVFNPSYFAPNQYRLFGKVSGNEEGWKKVIDTGYAVLEKTLRAELGNATNGLAPAWADPDGKPMSPFDGAPTHYQYDSARIPFRIGQDYCEFGEPRAKAYLEKISSFFSNIGASKIVDGYDLNGTPRAENTMPAGVQAALFVGAASVGAMSDARYRTLVDEGYGLLVSKDMFPPSYYFNMSWQVFSLLMMSGNLFDYTLHP